MVAAELGSTKPQPCLPFCSEAASALQIPVALDPIWAQQAEEQSASETHPPVMNWDPSPEPTLLAPALLGLSWPRATVATVHVFQHLGMA